MNRGMANNRQLNLLKEMVKSGGPIRMEGMTYYVRNGKLQACASKRGRRKVRTEKEVAANDRFSEVRTLWRMYRRAAGELPVWRMAAREAGAAKSDSLFHSLNGACVRAGEGVWAFPAFRFAAGALEMPVVTGVAREGWRVTLEWEYDGAHAEARDGDRVYVGYFYGTQPQVPQLAVAEGVCRKDGRAVVDIPPMGQPEGTPLHLYLFFGTERNDRFSPSVYCPA